MQITEITVKQTIQLKQFCPLTIEATAELLDADNPDECAMQLRQKVETWINAKPEKIDQIISEEIPY